MLRQAIVQSPNYKWWCFATVAIGTYMSVIDSGSVIVALPRIGSHFEADLATVQWVFLGWALSISVLLLPMGRLSDVVGRKQVYLAGFAIFVLSSAAAGFSTNLTALIAARVIQGAGTAILQAVGMAIIISAFPENERGKAVGSHMSIVGTGMIAGPALGGFLVSAFDWYAVFFINVPVGIIAIIMAMIVLENRRLAQDVSGVQQPRFDWLGAALSTGFLLTFLLAMTNGNRVGWGSATILGGFLASAALMTSFIWWELKSPSPMLELRLFKRKLVALGVSTGWIAFLGASSVQFMVTFYLQRVLDFSAREVGLIYLPSAISTAVIGPLSGRLSDRLGWRRFKVAGLAMSTTTLFILSTMLTENSSLALILPALAFQSAGIAMFHSPNVSSILTAVERSRYGVVSAVAQLMRNSANVTGVAVAAAIVVATMGSMGFEPNLEAVSEEGGEEVAHAFVVGLHRAFMVMCVLVALALALSFIKTQRAVEVPEQPYETRVSESPLD